MSDQNGGPAAPEGRPLPADIMKALASRSEADVIQGPGAQEIAAARRVDGLPPAEDVPVPPDLADQASAASWPRDPPNETETITQLKSVLGPDLKNILARLLMIGWKIERLTDTEKRELQTQMLDAVRAAKPAAPNVLRMVPKRRIIRPGD